MRQWDVIILGAGPAGLALAARLAPTHRVLVAERAAAPATDWRIGESLPGAAVRLLERLGIYQDFLLDNHRPRTATVSQWASAAPVWEDGLRDPFGPGWVLDRRGFERRLQTTAEARGAVIEYGREGLTARYIDMPSTSGWQVYTQEGLDRDPQDVDCAPVLIDATGRSASIARDLGVAQVKLDQQICIHAFYRHAQDATSPLTHIFAVPDGWWYSVGFGDGTGVLALHINAKPVDAKAGAEAFLRAQLMQPDGFRARALADATWATPAWSQLLQNIKVESVQVRPAGSCVLDIGALDACPPGFLAIGDSLVSFDPIAAQGLFHALASAESAFAAITKNLATDPSARAQFCREQLQVRDHYLHKLRETYSAVNRFRDQSYWQTRATLATPLWKNAPEMLASEI